MESRGDIERKWRYLFDHEKWFSERYSRINDKSREQVRLDHALYNAVFLMTGTEDQEWFFLFFSWTVENDF